VPVKDTDYLNLHLQSLPYFRALIRAVEASYYQDLDLQSPILDVGCGDGHFASLVFKDALDVGLDPWHKPIHEARKRDCYRLLVEADAGSSPFPDNAFGSAFSNSVLEHIPHVESVLKETARVIKPGALFAFCVPNPRYFSSLALTHLFGKKYEAWFRKISRVEHADDPDIWKERLEKAGLELEQCWHYFSPAAMRALEWGHYFGLPSLVIHFLTGKWILVPNRLNLYFTERFVRRFASSDAVEDGTFTFYLARKPITTELDGVG
jgi:SAM-dependent methyltransferase